MRLTEVAADNADIDQIIAQKEAKKKQIEDMLWSADGGAYSQDKQKIARLADEIKQLKMQKQRDSGQVFSKEIAVDPNKQPEINDALMQMWGSDNPVKPWGFFEDGDGGVNFGVYDKKPGMRSEAKGATLEELIDFVEQRYSVK